MKSSNDSRKGPALLFSQSCASQAINSFEGVRVESGTRCIGVVNDFVKEFMDCDRAPTVFHKSNRAWTEELHDVCTPVELALFADFVKVLKHSEALLVDEVVHLGDQRSLVDAHSKLFHGEALQIGLELPIDIILSFVIVGGSSEEADYTSGVTF